MAGATLQTQVETPVAPGAPPAAPLVSATRPLAAYAANPALSAGRLCPEPPCPMRTPYQRDRDRIVHATAFRRLNYKTQVFLFHEGDHFRSRLTHSIEVAQIARAIARLLALDEDLAEALALAHDLGHTPFGHAGERAMASAMQPWGGFDHNAQSLRVVTRLERKYAAFDGLNLTFETLEGLAKHNGPIVGPGAQKDHAVLRAEIEQAGLTQALKLDQYAPAEAQAAAIADDIAYNSHDIDDGLRAGLLKIEALLDVPLVGRFVREARANAPDSARAIYEVHRRMITVMIDDVVATSRARLAALPEPSLDAVRRAGRPVVAFSDQMRAEVEGLQDFLYANVYRHPRINRIMEGAAAIVRNLFARYMADDAALPEAWAQRVRGLDTPARAHMVADFVAGMTDRYAVGEHQRLFDATPDLR
ncbi:MAG: deoxyguanosinetriphosphate triphosphohydrolase [Hyphomicrobiales bacterium]|nr:MAG: deoxyguanosinetriphosphate triphosphohydrolase [Hyphomicrobiales bacterium]